MPWQLSSFLCAFFFAIMALFYRAEMDAGASGPVSMLCVFVITIPCFLILRLFTENERIRVPRSALGPLALAVIACYASNVPRMEAFRLSPNPGYADALAVFEALVVTLVAGGFMRAELSFKKVTGIIFCLVGAVIITAFWENGVSLAWFYYGVGAAMLQVFFALSMRVLSRHMARMDIMVCLHVFTGFAYATHVLLTGDTVPTGYPIPLFYLGAGLFAAAGSVLELYGLSDSANPGYSVALVRSSSIILAVLSFLILGNELTLLKFVSLVLFIVGAGMVAARTGRRVTVPAARNACPSEASF